MSIGTALEWFKDARFGLFIHWGLYALPGGIWKGKKMDYIGEWLQAKFRIPRAEYEQLAAQFNPVGFDAEQWVKTAKNAGMKYMVFTAKHHEGFAMYHSKCDRFNIVDATPFGRDILAELVAACKKHDFKLGLYYSQDLDWHEPDGGDPGPDFPKNFEMSWGNDWDFPDRQAKNFERYFNRKVIPQITELLSDYGPIGMIWFDCPMTISRNDCERLAGLVKKLQPECLINTRIGHGLGDYGSLGDNQLPSSRLEGAWESPGTLNDTWGFKYEDHNWKSPNDVISMVAGLAAKDTNYLLNVGPQPDGCFPAAAEKILREVGEWVSVYGDSIHQSRGNPFPYEFEWGWMTVTPGDAGRFTRMNLLLRTQTNSITFGGLRERVRRCYDLAHPERDLTFTQDFSTDIGMVTVDLSSLDRHWLPVVGVELETRQYPDVEQRLIPQNGKVRLLPSRGRLHHGEDAAIAAEIGIGAAGERQLCIGHSQVDIVGNLVEWHNPSDRIEWEILLPSAGAYRLELVTTSCEHSAPWVGGQTIRMTYDSEGGRTSWEATLTSQPAQVVAGECYARGSADAGTLTVPRPGAGILSLTMLSTGGTAATRMALSEVRLTRI